MKFWRVVRWNIIAVLFVLLVGSIVLFAISKPLSKGVSGPEAERLGQDMLTSVNAEAWKRTGAVQFTFYGHRHLWDRNRGFDSVEWDNHRVLLKIKNQTGRVYQDGAEIQGDRANKFLKDAYAYWINDSFWLNPVVKIFDSGVTRSIVHDGDLKKLLVQYASGGITPGDAYLWTPGQNGAPPTLWQMWVHVFPVGGLSASWERWITLSTGAKVSTFHRFGPFTLELKDVSGASTLNQLVSEDPFTR